MSPVSTRQTIGADASPFCHVRGVPMDSGPVSGYGACFRGNDEGGSRIGTMVVAQLSVAPLLRREEEIDDSSN